MQVQNFSKIRSKIFEKYFFENISSFSYRGWLALSPDMRIFFTVNNEGGVGFFCWRYKRTDGLTDGRTYTFLKFPSHTDSNGI